MNILSYDDPIWVKDYQEALRDLMGEQLLLPTPKGAECSFVCTVTPAEEPDSKPDTGRREFPGGIPPLPDPDPST